MAKTGIQKVFSVRKNHRVKMPHNVLNNNELLGGARPPRQSNLELLRILAMLAIIAHHSIGNGGLMSVMDFTSHVYVNSFIAFWGMWGKTAINSFILISGYFLCKGTLTWQRYAKLLIEVYFYKIVIMAIFCITGYEAFNIGSFASSLLSPLSGVNNGFVASFLAFYLFVPVYNALINALSKRLFQYMLGGLLLYFTVASTFLGASTMNEPFWYMTLYFIAAYIRLYPSRWTESREIAAYALSVSIMLITTALFTSIYIASQDNPAFIPQSVKVVVDAHPLGAAYWFLVDSNKLFALVIGLSAFLYAKNMRKFYSRTINWLAAGTFGVLLIHANSATMRQWLWADVLDMTGLYDKPALTIIATLVAVPVVIFAACSVIDYMRRIIVERPIMNWLNNK